MLHISVKPGDNVLLYDADTLRLLGPITYTNNSSFASLEFRLTDNIIVVREELVLKVTNDISVCPADLAKRFGKKRST